MKWTRPLTAQANATDHGSPQKTDAGKVIELEKYFIEDSPYDSVRAALRNTDNEEEVANTFRAWVLGFLFVTVASGINMFLYMRSPAITIATVVIILLVHPIGVSWAKVMPTRKFNTFGLVWSLHPGPFTMKEHAVVTLMANVTYGYAYSTDELLALDAKPLYNIRLGWGFQLLFTLSSQIIAALIWPADFSITTLLCALHDKSRTDPAKANGWSISRYRFFVYVALGSFAWYWFPGVIWQSLSVFSFVTWIRPNDVVLNQLFGGFTGLSLVPLTFDWIYVSAYLNDPLFSPTFSHLNTLIGLGIFVIISTTGISYSEKYKSYPPLFLAPTFVLSYGLSFAALTAAIVHTVIYHGKEAWFKAKYRESPDWWYGVLFVISVALGLATVLGYSSQLLWWGYFVSIIIALVFTIPCCMALGITNIQLSLNVISPFLAGFMIPGKPIGVMIFRVFSTVVLGQAQTYTTDLNSPVPSAEPSSLPPSSRVSSAPTACSAPATPLSFSSWAIVGVIFNWWIKKRYRGWWFNYNYIFAAAVDCGLVVLAVVIFLAFTLSGSSGPSWWGHVGVFETMDALGTAVRKTVVDGETLGPQTW
ncbi:OPT superfamily oligopeptide transporter [Polychaeton citri CBS 116435]|uniref:OPT superfamily oligopeptide transporter n=1 Tax=Polychaeton citri CBS 116435 TaxID=1314669 RepID=A0A9P4Q2W1_9PEZI|nr:OPT superfamily oligopeptide transporter [Polychaeton citri CBS 116435]